MKGKPLMFDFFCGLGGASGGFLSEGWECVGIDNERHDYGQGGYPGQLVLADVLTFDGRQCRNADFLWFSPPCTEFSYMAMPWSRAKRIAHCLREGDDVWPEGYTGSRTLPQLKALWYACWRIQIEASHAARRYIPMVIENVRGAQPWVGRAKAAYGSFLLWGDIAQVGRRIVRPDLKGDYLIAPGRATGKRNPDGTDHGSGNGPRMWSEREVPRLADATKTVGLAQMRDGYSHQREHDGVKLSMPGDDSLRVGFQQNAALALRQGTKQAGISGTRENGKGDRWFQDGAAKHGSKSDSRKAASAMIAKIPEPLSRWVARAYRPL